MPPTEVEPTSLFGLGEIKSALSGATVSKVVNALEEVLSEMGVDPSSGERISHLSGSGATVSENLSTLAKRLRPADREKLDEVIQSGNLSAEEVNDLKILLTRTVSGVPALISGPKGETLLDNLHAIATTDGDEIKANIRKELSGRTDLSAAQRDKIACDLIGERKNLIASLISETARPAEKINQGDLATCPVTADTLTLATESPAEYARIHQELFINGSARGRYGSALHLVPGSIYADTIDGGAAQQLGLEKRSISERIGQSALMQFAAGVRHEREGLTARYDPKSDTTSVFDQRGRCVKNYQGLHDSDAEYATEFLFGGVERVDLLHATSEKRESALAMMEESLDRGKLPKVSMAWNVSGAHSYHVLNVIDVGKDYVDVRNPWGSMANVQAGSMIIDPEKGIYRIPKEQFLDSLRYAVVDLDDPRSLGVAADIMDRGARPNPILVEGATKGDYEALVDGFGFDSSQILRDIFLGRNGVANTSPTFKSKGAEILKEILRLALEGKAGSGSEGFWSIFKAMI